MAKFAPDLASGHIHLVGSYSTARTSASLVPVPIMQHKRLGPGAKLVYSKLYTYALAKQTATNSRLAADLAVSPRSVRNYISALKSAGLIDVRTHPGKPNSYALTRVA